MPLVENDLSFESSFLAADHLVIAKAVSEGEFKAAPPALFALMNHLDVLGKRFLGEAFPTELALDPGRPSLSSGRFS